MLRGQNTYKKTVHSIKARPLLDRKQDPNCVVSFECLVFPTTYKLTALLEYTYFLYHQKEMDQDRVEVRMKEAIRA